jgi:predicted XRE-type DNA-binding protein
MEKMTHWTANSTADFVYRIASDFVAQLEMKLEAKAMGRKEYAVALGVTPGRVSQFLNDPGSFELSTMVNYAQPLGMKVSVVVYEDGDPQNQNGPISSQVFNTCWTRCGSPHDVFEAAVASTGGVSVSQIAANESGVTLICGTTPSTPFNTANVIWYCTGYPHSQGNTNMSAQSYTLPQAHSSTGQHVNISA